MPISLSDTSKPVTIADFIESDSSSVRDDVTIDVISNLAIKPVIDGIVLGALDVGEITGDIVGRGVTKTAHTKFCDSKILVFQLLSNSAENP